MGQNSSIEWTDATWNPVVGCQKVSEGCRNCYAKTLHDLRHKAHSAGKRVPVQYAKPFEAVQTMPLRLKEPLSWRKPRRVFVNSMSDLFHDDVPDEFLLQVFDVMRRCTWAGGQNCGRIGGDGHTFQILTKRPGRMLAFCSRLRWDGERVFLGDTRDPLLLPINRGIWLGVSVENQAAADERIPLLLKTPAAVRFLSCEPLLSAVDLRRVLHREDGQDLRIDALTGEWWYAHTQTEYTPAPAAAIDWVIVGGESGPGARPMLLEWAESLRDQCAAAGVPFFLKQLGAHPRRLTGAGVAEVLALDDRKGGDPEEWPADLRVREYPEVKQ